MNLKIKAKIGLLYEEVDSLIINGHLKKSLEKIFEFVRYANKYFDEQKPWVQIKEEKSLCDNTMANCIYIISNLAQLLNPFLPFSSHEVKNMLRLSELKWEEIELSNIVLKDIKPLFERIEKERIEEELENLNNGIS